MKWSVGSVEEITIHDCTRWLSAARTNVIEEVTLESDFMVPRDLVEESIATASSNPMSEPWEAFLRNDNMFGSSAAPSDLFEQMQLPQQSTRDNLTPLYDYDDMLEARTKLSEDTVESILA